MSAAVSLPVNVFCWDGWYERIERQAGAEVVGDAVAEGVAAARRDAPDLAQHGQEAVHGHPAQGQDRAHAREQRPLPCQVLAAVADLLRQRPVAGRRAARDRGHVAVDEAQAVVAGDGDGLVGEARAMQRGEEEIARAVAGEDAAGAVAAVRGGGQAHDQQARARGRPSPGTGRPQYSWSWKRRTLTRATVAAPVAQAPAALAGHDIGRDGAQGVADAARLAPPPGSQLLQPVRRDAASTAAAAAAAGARPCTARRWPGSIA